MSNLRIARAIARNIGFTLPVKFLGGGVNGRVYETNNGRLMKFIYDYAPQEYAALQRLQGTHVVPRFKKGEGMIVNMSATEANTVRRAMFPGTKNISSELTVFVMGRVGNAGSATLRKYVKQHPSANKKNIARRVGYLVKEMHLRGVSHGNLHDENIIVSFDSAGRITGMWAIDFGRSRNIPLGQTETKMYKPMTPNAKFPTRSVYRTKETRVPVYLGSRSNIKMRRAVVGAAFPKGEMKNIAKLRSEVASIMKNYKSPSKTPMPKAKTLSPRRQRTPSVRPRSAPARIATPQKGLKFSISLKRKRSVA